MSNKISNIILTLMAISGICVILILLEAMLVPNNLSLLDIIL